jgi:hypothetical protein
MAKRYDNWYVSQIKVSLNSEGRVQALESVLTVPEASKSKMAGHRMASSSLSRFKAIGIEHIFLCEPDHKRYSKLLKEQNKRTKVKKMSKREIEKIMSSDLKEEAPADL